MSFCYEIQYEWCNIFLSCILTSQLTFCLKYLASMRLLHKKNDFAFDRRSSEEVKYPSG